MLRNRSIRGGNMQTKHDVSAIPKGKVKGVEFGA